MRRILFLLLLISHSGLFASHIVGGELFYTRINATQYRISLKLFRDCFCVNCAGYGDPEYISVFDSQGNLINQIDISFPGAQQINPPINNNCMVQPDVCVERAIYTKVVSLPPRIGGYDLVYQRCCRNVTISNILLDAGATYLAHIPGSEVTSVNSSPSFNNFPPIYICNNVPLSFDHSATDPDGDVLRYELYTPYSGADPNCPDPSPNSGGGGCPTAPTPPPYAAVTWLSPFGLNNQLNNPPTGLTDLRIDSITGRLTVTPNTLGQFVVGVKVKEIRNGVVLGETLRDFQFNVATCNIPIASIPSSNFNPATGLGLFTLNCDNYSVSFRNTTFNPPPQTNPLTYFWDFGVPGITTDTSSAVNPTYVYPDTGTYRVMLVATKEINAINCGDTTYAEVKVYPLFRAGITLRDTCVSNDIFLTDSTISNTGQINSWRWSFGDGTSSQLRNPSKQYSNPGTYNVTLITTNDKGCRDTASRQIVIFPNPAPAFTVNSGSCVFDTLSFTNTTSGSIVSNLWSFGNGQTSTLRDPRQNYNAAGNYTVTLSVTNTSGCTAQSSRSITVNALPVLSISPDTTICPGTSLGLFASGGVAYLWSPPALLNNPSSANPTANPIAPTTIYVEATDANGCKNKDSLRVSLYPAVIANAGPDTSVCLSPGSFRDSVRLQASGGISYRWSPALGLDNPNVSSPMCRPLQNTTYLLQATDVSGCIGFDSVNVYFLDPALNLIVFDAEPICEGDSVQLQVIDQGVSQYRWSPTGGLSNPNVFSPLFYPSDTTTYILLVSNYCYTKSDTVTVLVLPLPDVLPYNLDSICLGDSLILPGQNAVIYRWSPSVNLSSDTISSPVCNSPISRIYSLTGTDALGCSSTEQMAVRVNLPSSISISPDTPFICRGQSIGLRASGADSYRWLPPNFLSDSLSDSPLASPDSSFSWTLEATNRFGCISRGAYSLSVIPYVEALAREDYGLCSGSAVNLSAAGGEFFRWRPGEFLSDSLVRNPLASPDSDQLYTIFVSNQCFTDSADVWVRVLALPQVDAGPDTLVFAQTQGLLSATTDAQNGYWLPENSLFDPLSRSTLVAPSKDTRYYFVAISDSGCRNMDSVLVRVEVNALLLIPTAFSPNNDGVNDLFRIVTFLNVSKINTFTVFNRWGEQVFQTDQAEEGWDGTFRGQPQPAGVYVWYIQATDPRGEAIFRKGNITLVR